VGVCRFAFRSSERWASLQKHERGKEKTPPVESQNGSLGEGRWDMGGKVLRVFTLFKLRRESSENRREGERVFIPQMKSTLPAKGGGLISS